LPTSQHGSPSAAARPRVDTHPPYVDTFGPEAVELAAAAGLIMDPWQADALHTMLAFKPDGKWAHFEYAEIVSRQNGKGSILEARALAGLFLLGEELIMWSAHEVKTAMEGFRRVKRLLKRIGTQVKPNDDKLWDVDGRIVKIIDMNGEEGLECLDNEQRLKFIARSKSSGRGFSGDVNIIDEAFAYTHEQQEALLFTMAARPNPQIIYTSSPPLDGVSGDVLFGLRHRGDPDAPRTSEDGPWQQDPELAWRDWGLPGDLEHLSSIDLDDVNLWRATNPSLGLGHRHSLTMKTVERERRSFLANPAGFARERLGVWPRRAATGAGVIDAVVWRELGLEVDDDRAGRPTDLAFAVVVAVDRSYTAIAAVGPQKDGRLQGSIVAYHPGTDWVPDRMDTLKRWNPIAWAIEDKGATASLWPELERRGYATSEDRDKPRRGDVAVPWATDVVTAYGLLIDTIKQKRFAHLRDVPLEAAVTGANIRPLGSGTTWDHRSPVDVSPLRAITNALWAYVTRFDAIEHQNMWDHVY
jgi:phage terminase large subunit-like protein